MIRLPSSHAAITAPLVASAASFPGIPIGRSLLDGRPFHLSPVLVDQAILPSTNRLAMGGLGSGKSTTDKVCICREICEHGHQAVVIDSFGENNESGEWRPVVQHLGGRVIEADKFTLNPISELFPPQVREQLVRSLILASEPHALNTQATHALQHALNHPKATNLGGLVNALISPQDGRWPAKRLAEWGEVTAMALSRYTEGSLRGIFDGQDSALPETDLPILSFDFTTLDRNSPAIPSLMAAVSCWAEHVWLRQSTAVHRHLVLEEAWQILLSPATSELIQRLLKNSRKAALSLDVVMHTLSDLGDGKAQDLAKLCEIAHVGRLGPEEAAIVGALLGLPQWAIDRIPSLDPGQAVWKVGPAYVDIIQTVIDEEEAAMTDTATRRRAAQQAYTDREASAAAALEQEAGEPLTDTHAELLPVPLEKASEPDGLLDVEEWDWAMPPNVIDIRPATPVRAPAVCDEPVRATQLRATVDHMGNEGDWWEQSSDTSTPPLWHRPPEQPAPQTQDAADEHLAPPRRRRTWPYVAAVAALALTGAGVWQNAGNDQQNAERETKAAAFKGRSTASLNVDGVNADVVARWTKDRDRVIVELRSYDDPDAKYLRIDANDKNAISTREDGWYPQAPELAIPVTDPLADVTVRIAIGGKTWKPDTRSDSREIRLSPTGTAHDATTGEQLPD